jgi:hypothetical protein
MSTLSDYIDRLLSSETFINSIGFSNYFQIKKKASRLILVHSIQALGKEEYRRQKNQTNTERYHTGQQHIMGRDVGTGALCMVQLGSSLFTESVRICAQPGSRFENTPPDNVISPIYPVPEDATIRNTRCHARGHTER